MSTHRNNGIQPADDAYILDRKQWSNAVADWGLEFFLQMDKLEESDAERVLHYFRSSFRNQRGEKAFVSDPFGTWLPLDPQLMSCQVRWVPMFGPRNG